VPTLILDHHAAAGFPEGAQVLSGYGHEPVATSAMLAYACCKPLLGDEDAAELQWLAGGCAACSLFPSLFSRTVNHSVTVPGQHSTYAHDVLP
jgi:hypothetical protein